MAKGNNASQDHVKQLVAKGFTKNKATQALKDAGNNFQVAVRILERQRDQAAATTSTAAMQGSRATAQCGPVASRVAPTSAKADTRESVRRHPCIVQFKSCQYGQFCRLKDFPGDTCIQYFHGSCVFGDACKHRHFIDGVDIREAVRREKVDTFVTEDGTFRLLDGSDGKLQRAERLHDETNVDASPFVYLPQQADFNRVRGAEPTHTDPYAAPVITPSVTIRPTPFLDSLKRGLESTPSPSPPPPARVTATTATPTASSSTAHADRKPAAARAKHPCVAQFGFCKYGDTCNHADRDADVCVHFLNGRCKFDADTCHYRHETDEEYIRKLMAELDGDGGPTEEEEVNADEGQAAAPIEAVYQGTAKHKQRLQDFRAEPTDRHCAPHSSATSQHVNFDNGVVTPSAFGYQSAAQTAPPRPEANPYLVKEATRQPFTLQEFLPPALQTNNNNTDEMYDEDGYPYDDDYEEEEELNALGSENPQSDRELEQLLRLMEVFPTADPLVVMQALRSCGADQSAAADMLSRVTALESREEGVDEVLAQALAEEEAEVARKTEHEAAARCEGVLTLCVLFPKVEPAGIEAVLQRCQHDFHDAYGVLLCAQENLSRRAYGNFWSGRVNPAESLKLTRLEGMFPELHPDIVRSTFGNCGSNVPKTIDALNQLTSELLALETRESLGDKATRWRPHQPLSGSIPSTSQATAVACPVETHDELAEAYRDAERECREFGDWRRVRERAYLVNTARIRMLALASAAFANDEGRVAKLLSREGKDLGKEYARLNRLAMLALERERLATQPTSTLDVHDFHVSEATEVLYRRVDLCRKKRISRLTVIVGEGKHSRREGHSLIYPVLLDKIRQDPYFKRHVRLVSVKPSFLELNIVQSD